MKRKIQTLQTLIRTHEVLRDQLIQKKGLFEARIQEKKETITALDAYIEAESSKAHAASWGVFPAFLQRQREAQATLQKGIHEAQEALDAIMDSLAYVFEEIKKCETLLEIYHEHGRIEEKKKEQHRMDESAARLFYKHPKVSR